ncbi:MAG TPA: glycoside hydrolase family 31 protein, partial [Candidatus Xenobia bacterium]
GLEIRVHADLRLEFWDDHGHCLVADQRPPLFERDGPAVAVARRLRVQEHFYGLGEKAARLDKRRQRFTMWNSDTPAYPEGCDPIYQSVPFYIGLNDGLAYGTFFDNSCRTWFDFGRLSQEYVHFAAEDGPLDYYFMAGPKISQVVERYSEVTGLMPLPPRWALGHQQSRYSYYPDTVVEEIVETFRRRDLPLDVVHLDIHYMDGYRCFTFDPRRFPDPAGLMRRLQAQGVRVVTIVDPGIKYQPTTANGQPALDDVPLFEQGYPAFDEGVKEDYFQRFPDGRLYLGEVWPGKCVFVDYTQEKARRWWGDLHRAYTDVGVAGIWNDMNEPADFTDQTGETQRDVVCWDEGRKTNHGRNRNVFGLLEARATYEGLVRLKPHERPFVLTRAGFAGIQRYASTWTGDNNSTWEHLALTIPMFASMGLSGQAFVGADVGGFLGRCSGELLTRWYQAAFLSPLCRNHKAVDAYDQEPWRFGPAYEAIIRRYLKLRYRLMPYLYTWMEEASRTGTPVFRPLVFDWQEDENTHNLDDQFLVGPDLLLAPILHAGQSERLVYFPAGRWYDFWTGIPLEGGGLQRVAAPIETCPMFVRGGAALPLGPEMSHTDERPLDPLTWQVYPDAEGAAAGVLYEDDGLSFDYQRGAYRKSRLSVVRRGDAVTAHLEVLHDGWQPPARHTEILLEGRDGRTRFQDPLTSYRVST